MKLLPVLLLAAATGGAMAAPRVAIELRPEVQAGTTLVKLGQVARIESTDLVVLRRLIELPVGRAPAAGESAVLEREVLAGWLRSRMGLASDQVAWTGPAASRVISSSRTVPGDDIAGVATAALQQWLVARGARSDIDLVAVPRDIAVAEGELRLQARDLANAQPRSRMTVWVEVWSAGRFLRVMPVTYVVAAWAGGVAVAEPLAARGEAQSPVVAAVPAVVRGDWAALRSLAGVVVTEARVQVLQDGRIGDNVRVRASASTTSLIARVTGAGQVEVAR